MKKDKNKKVNSIGFIIDGNRRWAVEQGMSKLKGHWYGMENVKKAIVWCQEENIDNLVFYVLSTENWRRSKIEIKTYMKILKHFIEKELQEIIEKNVSIKFIGDLDLFPKSIKKLMIETEEKTKNNKTKVYLAASYGGRLEIVEAVKKLSLNKSKKEIQNLTEKEFEKYLWTAQLPDPEIIIRTGGDQRLSNFLTWKSIYSELIFVKTKWPAFSKREFTKILKNYLKDSRINKGK